jgi:peptide deformylase
MISPMATREIVTLPDPVLRQKARKVPAVTEDVRRLIDDMVETMRAAPGVGLAAPQVGDSRRVIVVEYAEPPEQEGEPARPPKLFALVNPEIVRRGPDQVKGVEGCLSVPGFLGEVERTESITLQGLNRAGQSVRIKAAGWLARIFQHEIDHLEGTLFIDRATDVWKGEAKEIESIAAD